MSSRTFSDRAVDALPLPPKGYVLHREKDEAGRATGLAVRVSSTGVRAFLGIYYVAGQERRMTIGTRAEGCTTVYARKEAARLRRDARFGVDPLEERRTAQASEEAAESDRFKSIVSDFLKRHAAQNKTARETERIFDVYVLPSWGDRSIRAIKRRDVVELLDRIEDCEIDGPKGRKIGGKVMADRTLAAIRKLFNWFATRDDEFISPVVQGMGRTKARELERDRVLSDDELRLIWPLLAGMGTFGAIVKMLIFTGQRREEVAQMSWPELSRNGTWTVPAERYKTGLANVVPLPRQALAITKAQRRGKKGAYVFSTTDGASAFNGFGKAKARLDALVLETLRQRAVEAGQDPDKVEPLPAWRLHDLRRTARSLMSRAGVRPDIAERVLGHVVKGVERVYDRHSYEVEKAKALQALANLIGQIAAPAPNNVRRLRK